MVKIKCFSKNARLYLNMDLKCFKLLFKLCVYSIIIVNFNFHIVMEKTALVKNVYNIYNI